MPLTSTSESLLPPKLTFTIGCCNRFMHIEVLKTAKMFKFRHCYVTETKTKVGQSHCYIVNPSVKTFIPKTKDHIAGFLVDVIFGESCCSVHCRHSAQNCTAVPLPSRHGLFPMAPCVLQDQCVLEFPSFACSGTTKLYSMQHMKIPSCKIFMVI